MHGARPLGTLCLTVVCTVPAVAVEFENASATFRMSDPDSWVVIASDATRLEVATCPDPYRGHGVPYVATGAAVIIVVLDPLPHPQ